MNCQWGDIAPQLGLDSAGAHCAHACERDTRFCEQHLRKLAEHAAASLVNHPESLVRDVTNRFLMALVGALGTAVVTHWDRIVAIIESIGFLGERGGFLGTTTVTMLVPGSHPYATAEYERSGTSRFCLSRVDHARWPHERDEIEVSSWEDMAKRVADLIQSQP